jgi:hypothetical protein
MENTACSTVVGGYHVYRAVAWQYIDEICHNTLNVVIIGIEALFILGRSFFLSLCQRSLPLVSSATY